MVKEQPSVFKILPELYVQGCNFAQEARLHDSPNIVSTQKSIQGKGDYTHIICAQISNHSEPDRRLHQSQVGGSRAHKKDNSTRGRNKFHNLGVSHLSSELELIILKVILFLKKYYSESV